MKTKFAIIDDERRKPEPNLRGRCQCCGGLMIAKCGNINVWHWAHKAKKICDPWWGNETEWHLNWKNQFPESWQEIVHMCDETGEKHIADVKTDTGMFIEFQNSPIKPEEQASRERFYKNMVWIVNGARRKTDYRRFRKGLKGCRATNQRGVFTTGFVDEMFPALWGNRPVPVLFDFQGAEGSDEKVDHDAMWCLLPARKDWSVGIRLLAIISKSDFVEYATKSDSQGNLFDKLNIINSG